MQWLFFSPSGRIGRGPYILAWLFWLSISGFAIGRMMANQDDYTELVLWTLALVTVAAISTLSIVMLTIKRLHDIGYPGHLAFCLFIPVLSPVVFVALCAWPGMLDANAYGLGTNTPSNT